MALSGFDRRRINGPEESFQPVFEPEHDGESTTWKIGEPRRGRTENELRSIFLKLGLISQANGSAYIETDKTKIACAVYGPRQSKNTTYSEKGRLNVEVKFAPFSCERRRAPMRDAEDRAIAMAIHQAIVPAVRLELFPKSTIDIFLTVIETDGLESCVASGSIAASAALADAGIEMLGMVMSCTVAVIRDGLWVDPTEEESKASQGTVVLSCLPALGTITSVWQNGRIAPSQMINCMEISLARCEDIHSVVAQTIIEKYTSGKDP